jgi:hypothetical protein
VRVNVRIDEASLSKGRWLGWCRKASFSVSSFVLRMELGGLGGLYVLPLR